jgi:hypothetical protein
MRRHPSTHKRRKNGDKNYCPKICSKRSDANLFSNIFSKFFFVSDQFGFMKRKHTNMAVCALQKKHQRIKQITNLSLTVLFSILYDSRSRLM